MIKFTSSRRVRAALSNKWTLLSVISIGTLMSTLDGGMVAVSYPALAEALDTDTSTVLWVTVAYWVTAIGLMLTLGWIGDVAGRRRVLTLGYVVFTLGILMAAGALNIWHLIGARIFQGVGASMILSNLNAMITATFPSSERGRALGVSGAVVGVGLTAGPLLGGLILDALDWRALFYTRAPLGVLGALLAWWLLPRDRIVHDRFSANFIGAAALFGTLASLLLFVNQGGRLGFGSSPVIGMAVAAGIFLPVLVWAERRSARPILDTALFRTRQYTVGVAVLIGHYLSQGGILLVAPFFFIDSMHYSATKMGLFIAAFSIARAFLAPVAGRLSDLVGPRPFLVLGNLILAFALLWLSLLGTGTAEWILFAALLLAGVGTAFFEPVITSVIMGSVPQNHLGTASASVAMGRQTAFSIGVTVAGAIYAIRHSAYLAEMAARGVATEVAMAEAIAWGFGDTLLAGAVLAAVAAVLPLYLGANRWPQKRVDHQPGPLPVGKREEIMTDDFAHR